MQHGECEARRMNPKVDKHRASPDTHRSTDHLYKDEIVQSRNFSYSSIRMGSIDDMKKAIKRLQWFKTYVRTTTPFTLVKRDAFCWTSSSGLSIRKISYGAQAKLFLVQMDSYTWMRQHWPSIIHIYTTLGRMVENEKDRERERVRERVGKTRACRCNILA